MNKVSKKINFTAYANTNRGLEIILGWKLIYFLGKDGHIQGIEATCSMHKAHSFAQTRQGLKRKARMRMRGASGGADLQRKTRPWRPKKIRVLADLNINEGC